MSKISDEDVEIQKVYQTLIDTKDFEEKVAHAIRHAIDEVVAGRYTGRFSIDQIDKTEKTYNRNESTTYDPTLFKHPLWKQVRHNNRRY
ncbi:hypothetical protein HMSSN139_07840 [Paenibacillus sp. HMSSN-139]|nr:hypothetical protein HMSSN139_07840 [Paenibacillus sp. HMSSN-139]